MAKLTSQHRKKLSDSDFALPKKRKYPISGMGKKEDLSHARNALARVSHDGSPSEKKEVREKVHRKYPSIKESKKADAYGLIQQTLTLHELFGVKD